MIVDVPFAGFFLCHFSAFDIVDHVDETIDLAKSLVQLHYLLSEVL